jgi:hypothetical protein
MAHITKFDKQNISFLRNEMTQALEGVAIKYGLRIEIGNVKYSPTESHFKVQVNTVGINGIIETADRSQFIRSAALYGIDPSWIDQEFNYNGDNYKITGLNPRAKRHPVQVVRTSDDRPYRFSAKLIIQCMK